MRQSTIDAGSVIRSNALDTAFGASIAVEGYDLRSVVAPARQHVVAYP